MADKKYIYLWEDMMNEETSFTIIDGINEIMGVHYSDMYDDTNQKQGRIELEDENFLRTHFGMPYAIKKIGGRQFILVMEENTEFLPKTKYKGKIAEIHPINFELETSEVYPNRFGINLEICSDIYDVDVHCKEDTGYENCWFTTPVELRNNE